MKTKKSHRASQIALKKREQKLKKREQQVKKREQQLALKSERLRIGASGIMNILKVTSKILAKNAKY